MTKRPWNFSAGPAAMPLEVLQQAADEMTDWHGSGLSVMEMSHRGKEFTAIQAALEADLRELLAIPDDFAVLFMQGGARAENAIVPMNLIARRGAMKADYVLSGSWSDASWKEAVRYGDVAVAASSGDAQGNHPSWHWFPAPETWRVRPDASYLHLCSNETIGGVEYVDWPDLAGLGAPDVPLVVDVSSHILSRPVDFSHVGVLYGGAQKNLGPAGLTLVIVRRDLLGHALPMCPDAFNYQVQDRAGSMYNTPPTYAVYMAGLVCQWVKRQGGVAALEAINIQKSALLYDYIDRSGFYLNRVEPSVRSRMNVPFQIHDASLDAVFLEQAKAAGLLQLKGHKSVGGMRASIYNAVPLEAVQVLVDFMKEFVRRHG